MSPTLHIQLLGELRLWLDDEPLHGPVRPRQQALLAYLLLHRHAPQSRRQIAFAFWPDSSERQAYTNLRKLYFQLRQLLPNADDFLYADTLQLGWRAEAPFTLDVARLEQALERLAQADALDVAAVEQVVTLYRGELLPSCYDEWLLPLRRTLHEQVVRSLTQALEALIVQHEYAVGLQVATHLVRLDPLHEAAYRQLMHLRALSGDRAGALRVYHECVTVLEQELGVPPAAETQALYEHLLRVEPQPATPSRVFQSLPLVGRKAEWQTVQRVWQEARRSPRLMLIWGEAGMGKTRLVEEMTHWARLRPGTVVYARTYAAEGALNYAPVTTWLRSEPLRANLDRLDRVWLSEIARLLPELHRDFPDLPPPAPMSEGWQRQRFYEVLARAVLAAPRPALLVLDDLQWCDEETLAWLRYLLRFDAKASLLVIGTARTEEVDATHPLHHLLSHLLRAGQLAELTLPLVGPAETVELAQHVAGRNVNAWAEHLYQETEGNPLFVVEMVRAGLVCHPHNSGEQQAGALPSTVHAVIATRLAQLSPSTLELAQLAATIGRAFTLDVLAVAGELSDDELVQGMDELWHRRLVREQATGYDFSHDKIRDVVYSQLSQTRRRLLHRRIATALATLYAGNLDIVVGELAVHAEQAGQLEQAVGYHQRAGELALTVGAYPEAVARLRRAISLLQQVPLAPEAAMRQELAMQVPLGACLVALRGYGDSEVEAAYKRAYQLCTQLGEDPHLVPTLVGLALFYLIRGELKQALTIGQQSLQLAQHLGDDGLLLEGHLVVGPVLQYLGDFRASVPHLEQVLALYDPKQHGIHATVYGHEPGATARVILAISLWFLGEADRSLHLMQEGLALAQQVGHRYTLNLAQTYCSQLYHLRRESAAEEVAAKAGVELAHRQGFQYWLVICTMFRCWAAAHLLPSDEPAGEPAAILAQMQEAFAGFKQTGAGLLTAYYLGVIAEAQLAAHDLEASWATLQQALSVAAVSEDRFYLPALQHLRGELILARGEAEQAVEPVEAEAEAAFLQAMQTAQQQEARILELRAAMSLARLWMRQGRRARAYELLAPRFAWFTEGFDTPDLQAAQRLLAELEA